MRIIVTGATGLLGNNVVRAALQQGIEVVAISRSAKKSRALQGLDVETIDTDLTQWDSVKACCRGSIDAVVHCAAHIHIGWKEMEAGQHINAHGTLHALRLAEELGCRCIHVSTVNTLAIGTKDRIADEDTPGDGQIPCTYVVSKRAAEKIAMRSIEQGGDVVIVYPGFMLGPWDWKPSSGRMLCDLSHGAPPLAPSGGCSVCDPRDVAAAILSAIDRAPRGGRYILAGENWSYLQLWREITSRFGARQPWTTMRLPARIVAGTIGDCVARFTKEEPIVNSAAIAMASQFHWYSSQRAVSQIGYRIRPASQSISDAIEWLRDYGYLYAYGERHSA